jgi:hypothetical protein
LAICAFLVLATPFNIYSALHRVQFGGHSSGPWYLAISSPTTGAPVRMDLLVHSPLMQNRLTKFPPATETDDRIV